ncbi:MAG TPA: VWA domain-containing protein, partial [Hanamia sp.]|nr:VWA domain-containing protein [Hanamia sp.]
MIHFQYIEYLMALAALPIIVLFYFLVVKWKRNAAKKIGDPELVKEITAQYSSGKFFTKFILFIIAFALCAFAVAGLIKPDGTQKISRKGSDIMIALDVSKSMLAQDIKPNRLERAKQMISKIIDNSPDDKIGLVIFAGRAYLQMPLTLDHAAAKMYLNSASPDDVPTQGTVISQALKMSYAAFNPKEKTYKSVLLISDGEDHDDEAIKVAKQLAEQGIMINTIGIGSVLGAPIMDEETGQ